MSIRRAMPTVRSSDLDASREFYVGFLGFDVGMDTTGFLMLHSPSTPTTQVIIATDDADDREVLRVDVNLEVSDVDEVHAEARRRGLEVVYPLTDEPWGIRRFFVRDPDGYVINVASHTSSEARQ
jgi:catechol 2,3-dioxygenase-like lactoylglutathione lyase family enzyme